MESSLSPEQTHSRGGNSFPGKSRSKALPLLMPSMEEIQDCVDGQFLGTLQSLSMEEATVDSQPEYPDLEAEGSRLRTFQNWPSYARVCPEVLAGDLLAGDFVRCFYCDGALRNWERGDDPWMEHARWFPRCKFLLQSRGRDFIDSIQESYLSPPVGRSLGRFSLQEKGGSWPRTLWVTPGFFLFLDASLSLEEKLRRLQEERMCKVCMDKDVAIVLVPCGHLVVCAECAPNLRRCPICRGVIRDTMKAFLS
uniref:RING-type E3 ubiquitin transferase n=1 Tax=Varanus komodoensis TaxID=61221 RepID=A0A8D2KS69_VARKO